MDDVFASLRAQPENASSTGGLKYDRNKIRTDLLPVRPLLDVARVLTFGARKYADRNWEKGIQWSRCYGAALRHLFAWFMGESKDPETGLSHLAHASCCIQFLQEFELTHPELDDRPIQKQPSMSVSETKRLDDDNA